MQNLFKALLLIAFTLPLVFATGCGPAKFGSQNRPKPGPPNNKPQCGLRPYLTVWQDQQLKSIVVPFTGLNSATINYGYQNFSAHPLIGAVLESQSLSVYFYQGPEGLSLNLILDKESGSNHANVADIAITVKNNQHLDQVLFSDEQGELLAVDADPSSTFYRGRFNYKLTTDGGIIGPLTGSDFEVDLDVLIPGELNRAVVFANLQTLPVILDLNKVMTFKISEANPCL